MVLTHKFTIQLYKALSNGFIMVLTQVYNTVRQSFIYWSHYGINT
jgi:hypothetical protein